MSGAHAQLTAPEAFLARSNTPAENTALGFRCAAHLGAVLDSPHPAGTATLCDCHEALEVVGHDPGQVVYQQFCCPRIGHVHTEPAFRQREVPLPGGIDKSATPRPTVSGWPHPSLRGPAASSSCDAVDDSGTVIAAGLHQSRNLGRPQAGCGSSARLAAINRG